MQAQTQGGYHAQSSPAAPWGCHGHSACRLVSRYLGHCRMHHRRHPTVWCFGSDVRLSHGQRVVRL